VTFIQQHLRRYVFGGSTESIRPVLDYLLETKIREFEISLRVEKDVLRLQVPVDDVLAVQVIKNKCHGALVEPLVTVFEPPLFPQMREELAPLDVFEHQIQVAAVVEGLEHVDNKRVVYHFEDLFLRIYVVDLL